MIERSIRTEDDMLELGKSLAQVLSAGDVVLFEGQLGAGKTTLIRGILQGLGWNEPVRSPTFSLFSVYSTKPPILHADLYRVASAQGTGIEDYLDTHLCLIEWPKSVEDWTNMDLAKKITIHFEGDERRVELSNISL